MMNDPQQLLFSLRSMTVYRGLLQDPAVKSLLQLLDSRECPPAQAAKSYGDLFCTLTKAGMSLSDYLYEQVVYDDNLYTRLCAGNKPVPEALLAAARHDLSAIGSLAYLGAQELKSHLRTCYPTLGDAVDALPEYSCEHARFTLHEGDWAAEAEALREFCRDNGYGKFARHHVFVPDEDANLAPLESYDPVTLEDLIGYEQQINTVKENTLALLAGKGGANILLYGDKGTGKSSTVKAVANSYADRGLRLILVKKSQILLLPQVFSQLAQNPMKFIIFLDDLSFSDIDDSFSALKSIIEGGEQVALSNAVIYATTNRRHLVRETFSSRLGDEVHLSDSLDEAVSLSDRFAITLTYLKLDRAEYIAMVCEMLARAGIADSDELRAQALAYSVRKGGYSPRVAHQFVAQKLREL
ncbi:MULTISPECIES: ATP-binding protein [Oscillospiraceae]|uniref:ATP-binding protein n=1 Tax=Oscillospiraceae TaxID=216572 RepID=UPI0009A5D438|nr:MULTISPECIES: ATP-binding protein [Oscillospiraceae]RGB68776.1 ATP-binding protein [Harryflintia acetispora]